MVIQEPDFTPKSLPRRQKGRFPDTRKNSALLSWYSRTVVYNVAKVSHAIELRYIQPGKPNQNAFIERFNRTYRHEVLDAYVFELLRQVREIASKWMKEYNEERPHQSLGQIPPSVFCRQIENAGNSSLELSP